MSPNVNNTVPDADEQNVEDAVDLTPQSSDPWEPIAKFFSGRGFCKHGDKDDESSQQQPQENGARSQKKICHPNTSNEKHCKKCSQHIACSSCCYRRNHSLASEQTRETAPEEKPKMEEIRTPPEAFREASPMAETVTESSSEAKAEIEKEQIQSVSSKHPEQKKARKGILKNPVSSKKQKKKPVTVISSARVKQVVELIWVTVLVTVLTLTVLYSLGFRFGFSLTYNNFENFIDVRQKHYLLSTQKMPVVAKLCAASEKHLDMKWTFCQQLLLNDSTSVENGNADRESLEEKQRPAESIGDEKLETQPSTADVQGRGGSQAEDTTSSVDVQAEAPGDEKLSTKTAEDGSSFVSNQAEASGDERLTTEPTA